MPTKADHTPPSWPGPYLTRAQIVAAGYASVTTLRRAESRGDLIPAGRRGGRGPVVYVTAAVDAWLRGAASPAPRLPRPPHPRRPASAPADALARIEATARGGAK